MPAPVTLDAVVRGLALTRIGVGAVGLLAPGLFGRVWLGPDGDRHTTRLAMRSVASRDLALGLGVLLAQRRNAPVRGWVEAGALADFLDGVASILGFGSLPRGRRWPITMSAALATGAGVWAVRSMKPGD
jgi:hypothetical protein